ncbi:unnamed protein product [Phyllotreta striolata]|uniref:Odorant receptor n=1 Tax=Phyllotreta striolata TaxID=444603 RepID=A0A9N9TL94_PHYSR|nr:unnamed protein product [Phyllotreta striolata]
MPDSYPEDFFVVNRWILKFAGMWRPDTDNVIIQALYTTYVIGIFLFVNIFFTSTEFLSLLYTYGNEYDLIKNISFALTHLMGAVKVVFFYYQGRNLKSIMSTLESDELRYESCEKSGFFPGLVAKSYKRTGIKYTVIFFMMAHATLTSSYLPPTIAALKYNEDDPESLLPDRLPYYSWMPFGFDTAGTYLIALGYQAIPMFSYAYSIVGMDTLFMNIMNCVGMNLEIIQGAFLSIRDRSLEKIDGAPLTADGLYNTAALNGVMRAEMRKISKHLQTVYRMCERLEDVHKFLTLAQTVATLFIICSCLYLVSSTPIGSKAFLAEIVYLIAMGFQLTLYCWFGNEVTLKANEMPFYIWQCDWLTADDDFKKSMIMSMARSKKPVYLTAGKFAPLTLPTFVAILKASYSFFAVIKNTSE